MEVSSHVTNLDILCGTHPIKSVVEFFKFPKHWRLRLSLSSNSTVGTDLDSFSWVLQHRSRVQTPFLIFLQVVSRGTMLLALFLAIGYSWQFSLKLISNRPRNGGIHLFNSRRQVNPEFIHPIPSAAYNVNACGIFKWKWTTRQFTWWIVRVNKGNRPEWKNIRDKNALVVFLPALISLTINKFLLSLNPSIVRKLN